MEPKYDIYNTDAKTMEEVSEFFNRTRRLYSTIWHEKAHYEWMNDIQAWRCLIKVVGDKK